MSFFLIQPVGQAASLGHAYVTSRIFTPNTTTSNSSEAKNSTWTRHTIIPALKLATASQIKSNAFSRHDIFLMRMNLAKTVITPECCPDLSSFVHGTRLWLTTTLATVHRHSVRGTADPEPGITCSGRFDWCFGGL
jgi:hypothetical protein